MPFVIGYIILIRTISFIIGKTYAGIIRYTSSKDAQRIFVVISIGSIVLGITDIITYNLQAKLIIPTSIIILDFIVTVFMLVAARTIVKVVYYELKNPRRDTIRNQLRKINKLLLLYIITNNGYYPWETL